MYFIKSLLFFNMNTLVRYRPILSCDNVICYSRLGEKRIQILFGNSEEDDHLEDLGLNGRIILKCMLKT